MAFSRVYTLDNRYLVTIARLYIVLRTIYCRYNFRCANIPSKKSNLVYVVNILVLYAMLIRYVLKEPEVLIYYLRILLFRSLIVVFPALCELHFGSASNIIIHPILAYCRLTSQST
jgi:hypothetical protein